MEPGLPDAIARNENFFKAKSGLPIDLADKVELVTRFGHGRFAELMDEGGAMDLLNQSYREWKSTPLDSDRNDGTKTPNQSDSSSSGSARPSYLDRGGASHW